MGVIRSKFLSVTYFLPLFLLAFSAFAQQERPRPGTVEGVAVNFQTGQPVADAPLRLMNPQNARSNAARNAVLPADRTVKTDAAGKFLFRNVDPGSYAIEPGAGFAYLGVQRDFPNVQVTVAPGQRVSGLRLPVVQLGSVAGRIVDHNDRPQAMVTVEVYELVYSVSGEKYLGQFRGGTRTDENGRYRITQVQPGELYLVARPLQGHPLFPVTYYPGVIDAENAAPITVSGAGIEGMNVVLRDAGLHTIRVRVPRPANVASNLLAAFTISTQSRGRFTTALMSPVVQVSQFGSYGNDVYVSSPLPTDNYIVDVTWVSPVGSFAATAMSAARWPKPKARFLVDLEDKDVDAGTISNWITPASISGKAFANGFAESPNFPQFNIALTSAEPAADSVRMTFAADGTFRLPDIRPGRYSIRATSLPAGAYLSSARFAGREILDTIFTIEQNSTGPLEVTVSAGAGAIDGTVASLKD